jgi:hypothetical protein
VILVVSFLSIIETGLEKQRIEIRIRDMSAAIQTTTTPEPTAGASTSEAVFQESFGARDLVGVGIVAAMFLQLPDL